MKYPVFKYRWRWMLKNSPEELWKYISNTELFNHDTGLPPVNDLTADGGELVNARHRLKFYRLGIPVEWVEEPFQWVRPERFGVLREYSKGPVAFMRVIVNLNKIEDGDHKTLLTYDVDITPRNPLGLLAIPIQVGLISRIQFGKIFNRYDSHIGISERSIVFEEKNHLNSGNIDRIHKRAAALPKDETSNHLKEKLLNLLSFGTEPYLSQLKPRTLSVMWNVPYPEVLTFLLQATRAGILQMQWEILCPLCRGAKESYEHLDELDSSVHCETCNIDFNANFEQSVSLTFRPVAAIRQVRGERFCVAGPQVTPHIIMQQLLPPEGMKTLSIQLEEGAYRFRALDSPGNQLVRVVAGGDDKYKIIVSEAGWDDNDIQLSHDVSITLQNDSSHEKLVILERTAWSDEATTAAEVTAMQSFRDLFSSEALRPGQEISVGSLAIVFTDLKASTNLYRRIGDAPAFGLVMDHFDTLKAEIVKENGSIVKTIGDAVMAAFRSPDAAVRAMIGAQEALKLNTNKGQDPLKLKVGIHWGPCIAVNLNERLDYFGTTVNMAARLEGFSSGEDIILSEAVFEDPAIVKMIAEKSAKLDCDKIDTTLKGFEGEKFNVFRITPVNQEG
ncbi:DUF5939 domain-containing protein [bacterium]|nr:DUF5939 domain-containing protein [bacterium]